MRSTIHNFIHEFVIIWRVGATHVDVFLGACLSMSELLEHLSLSKLVILSTNASEKVVKSD